jgi:starch synthase
MACGTPVVATATGGIPEVVAHDSTGILVPIEQLQDGSGKPLDEAKFVADFAAALNKMLSHPQLAEFGLAGRKRVEENFSWQSIAEQTIRVYEKAIQGIA